MHRLCVKNKKIIGEGLSPRQTHPLGRGTLLPRIHPLVVFGPLGTSTPAILDRALWGNYFPLRGMSSQSAPEILCNRWDEITV